MRYKQEIWEYFIRYAKEKDVIAYQKSVGRDNVLPFYDMDEARFARLLNTYRWLTKFSIPHIRMKEPITKPTNEEIVEAIVIVREQGEDLLVYAKKHKDVELRRSLVKKARKQMACADYYTELVKQDFFKDKELKGVMV